MAQESLLLGGSEDLVVTQLRMPSLVHPARGTNAKVGGGTDSAEYNLHPERKRDGLRAKFLWLLSTAFVIVFTSQANQCREDRFWCGHPEVHIAPNDFVLCHLVNVVISPRMFWTVTGFNIPSKLLSVISDQLALSSKSAPLLHV